MMIQFKKIQPLLLLVLISFGNLLVSCNSQTKEPATIPEIIDVNSFNREGLITLEKQEFKPDSNGIISDIKINLGTFEKGVYYRPFSEGKEATGNRVEPLWFNKMVELSHFKKQAPRMGESMNHGAFLMLKKTSGK